MHACVGARVHEYVGAYARGCMGVWAFEGAYVHEGA